MKIIFDGMVSKLLSELVEFSSNMTIKALQIWADFKVKGIIGVGCLILVCIHHHHAITYKELEENHHDKFKFAHTAVQPYIDCF